MAAAEIVRDVMGGTESTEALETRLLEEETTGRGKKIFLNGDIEVSQ